MESDEQSEGSPWRWSLLISVVFLNICLPSLLLSYGVLWVQLASNEIPLWLGLAAPSTYIFVYGLTQCWFREAADSWGGPVGYRVMATIGLFLVVTSVLTCAIIPLHFQPFIYGILGGFGSSLISAQVDAILYETYDSRLGLVRGMCYTGQAIGQSLFPHILFVLANIYGYTNSYIVLGGIMLQTLPAILLLKVDETKKYAYFSKYKELSQTLTCYKNEGIDNFFGTELHSLTKKCWKSPSDDNLHRVDEFDCDDGDIVETITPPPSPEEKRKNIFGVEILPEIPEESETDDLSISELSLSLNKKRLSNAIKRFSTLGDNIDECITSQVRKDSLCNSEVNEKESTEIQVTYETIGPITDIQTEKLFNSFGFRCRSAYTNFKRKLWIPSYKLYRAKRKMIYWSYNINDTFFKPLTRSLSCGSFYPALLLCFTKLSLTVGIVFMPVIASQMQPKMPMLEANFLMSLHAFTWICFIICTPWLVQTKKSNYKYITVCGLVISTCACFVLSQAQNQDIFCIGCVVAGFGYGIITSCWEKTAHEFVGARKWPKVHSTMETLSGTLIALSAAGLSFILDRDNGLQLSMFFLGVILSGISFIWIVIVMVYLYKTKIKSLGLRRKWLI